METYLLNLYWNFYKICIYESLSKDSKNFGFVGEEKLRRKYFSQLGNAGKKNLL